VLRDVSAPSVFVITSNSHVGPLRKRLGSDPGVVVFSETELLEAMRLIEAKAPKTLAVDAAVARTARGAQLVAAVKRESTDIRVLSENSAQLLLLVVNPDLSVQSASRPIEDGCGTRAAQRFAMKPGTEVVIDGERSHLVNLSTSGAQVVVSARVQPKQTLLCTLVGGDAETRLRALVAWSNVELASGGVRYRAGLAFLDANPHLLEAYCRKASAA
jgi:hypothetical protein